MQSDLHDLLREAKADAPPPRYDVDDVVRAGRRRKQRQITGWAAGAALAVVVAAGVPQILTRPSATAPPPRPATSKTTAPEINFTFGAYPAGQFHVSAPDSWTLAGMSADVRKKGGDPIAPEGLLTVYHPGIEPLAGEKGVTRTPVAPIGGRPAFALRDQGFPMLLWEYADDAYAIVTPRAAGPGRYAMSSPELRQVAAAFRLGSARPVTVAVRVGFVPSGYRLIRAEGRTGDDALLSIATFVPAEDATPQIADTDHGSSPASGAGLYLLQIEVRAQPPDAYFVGKAASGVECPDRSALKNVPAVKGEFGGRCYSWLPDDKHVVIAQSHGGVSQVDMVRVIDSITVADLGDPGTWFPLNQAFPASAQVGG